MSRDIKVVVPALSFAEAPRWRDDRLWFSDFYTHRVLSVREDGSDLRAEAHVPNQPSGLGWLPDGRLLVVSMRDARILRREADGKLSVHAELSPHVSGFANDMEVDAAGRAYVGNFGFDLMGGAPLEPTRLLRVDPDGTVTVAAEDLWFPNGSALLDGRLLLVNETLGNRVSAFDVAADGSLSNQRVWARFADLPADRDMAKVFNGQLIVAPDGGGIDAEGAWWIADAIGGRALRVREGGEILDEIHPGTGVYACTLGGADGRTLFICTAPDFYEEARKAAREAQIVAVKVDVPGWT